MRPNNQNKRSRGRSNSGRKHSNPLSRNYESNGPDVKIRGNAAHIAEKYQQLARDAQASGDSVMAENYLQHAEHYFRILSAAQALMPQRDQNSQGMDNNPGSQDNDEDDDGDDNDNSDRFGNRVDGRNRNRDNQARDEDAQPEAVAAPAPASEAAAEKNDASGDGDEERRKPRPRRPRRKPQAEQASADGGDDTASELPAFLTGGATTAAE